MESSLFTAGRLYRRALRDHWLSYTAGVLALLLCSCSEVLLPKFVEWALDITQSKDHGVPSYIQGAPTPLGRLQLLVATLATVLLLGLIGRIAWRQLLARRTHMAGRDLKVRLWSVLRLLPLRVFHTYPLGDLMNRATGDWNASRAIHGFTVVQTVDLIFFTLLSVACMFSISPQMTIYCLCIFPFLPYWIIKLAKKEHDLHLVAQDKLSSLSDAVSQSLETIRLQRATYSEALWQTRLQSEAKSYADARFEVVKTGWRIFPLGAVPTLIAYGILLFFGLKKMALGEISVGQFVALQSYVLMLQGPLFELGDCIAEWQKGLASLGRLAEVFNLHTFSDYLLAKQKMPELPAPGQALLQLNGLQFAYGEAPGEGQKLVLRDLHLTILAGESIGISGKVGAGKTTLLSLLAGLIEVASGQVFLAGHDLKEISRQWLAQHVSMVPQKAFLFADSVRSNLQLDQDFSDEELWRVLDLVQLGKDIRRLSEGLESWVGELGVNLSGGQKQRLALARALLRRRELLLLDDCLSAVDAVTEEIILTALRQQLSDVTVVWVAHRRSTLKLCDRVFSLGDGYLLAVDSHRSQLDRECADV